MRLDPLPPLVVPERRAELTFANSTSLAAGNPHLGTLIITLISVMKGVTSLFMPVVSDALYNRSAVEKECVLVPSSCLSVLDSLSSDAHRNAQAYMGTLRFRQHDHLRCV